MGGVRALGVATGYGRGQGIRGGYRIWEGSRHILGVPWIHDMGGVREYQGWIQGMGGVRTCHGWVQDVGGVRAYIYILLKPLYKSKPRFSGIRLESPPLSWITVLLPLYTSPSETISRTL